MAKKKIEEDRVHMVMDTYTKLTVASVLLNQSIKDITVGAIEEWIETNGFKNKVATVGRMQSKERS